MADKRKCARKMLIKDVIPGQGVEYKLKLFTDRVSENEAYLLLLNAIFPTFRGECKLKEEWRISL